MGTQVLSANTNLSVDSPVQHFFIPQPQHFNQGYIDHINATRLQISSDQDWVLKVSSNTVRMGSRKPIKDFQFKLNGQNTWRNLSQSHQVLRQGSAGQYILSMDYRMKLYWEEDRPGNYNVNIKYLITSSV